MTRVGLLGCGQIQNNDYVDVELRIPQVEKARRILGFEATVDLEEGIARTAEWYRKSGVFS